MIKQHDTLRQIWKQTLLNEYDFKARSKASELQIIPKK